MKPSSLVKILVAEDDSFSRNLIAKIVEQVGYVAIQSPDGQHALETLSANPDIAILVTDVMMPVMDGMEMARVIRGHSKTANLPIIMVSAVIGTIDLDPVLKLGSIWFLPKPLDRISLVKLVEQALAHHISMNKKDAPAE